MHAGSGAVLALMIVRLDAAIAAPPGAKADRPPFPGLHRHGGAMLRMDARGVTGIFAPCRRHASSMTAVRSREQLMTPAFLHRPISLQFRQRTSAPRSSSWAGAIL